jgi:hypothetical protein
VNFWGSFELDMDSVLEHAGLASLLHSFAPKSRFREQLVRQRTMLVNALRAHLAEFGIVAAQGLRNVGQLIAVVRDDDNTAFGRAARRRTLVGRLKSRPPQRSQNHGLAARRPHGRVHARGLEAIALPL